MKSLYVKCLARHGQSHYSCCLRCPSPANYDLTYQTISSSTNIYIMKNEKQGITDVNLASDDIPHCKIPLLICSVNQTWKFFPSHSS